MSRRVQKCCLVLSVVACCRGSVMAQEVGDRQARIFSALKPISAVSADIRSEAGALPQRTLVVADQHPPERHVGMTFCWEATNVSYYPLAFEEYNLERHGHSVGCLQPLASGAHFLGSVTTLPSTGLFCHERDYELGHIRPGSCAPFVVLNDGTVVGSTAFNAAFLLLL